MKAIKFMSLLMVAVLGFGSCSNDIPQYQPGNDQEDKNIGYLSLAGMQVSVMEDTEVVNSQTRAEGIDINTFDVVINNFNIFSLNPFTILINTFTCRNIRRMRLSEYLSFYTAVP